MKIVLVIDDEPSVLESHRVLLEEAGYRVLTAADATTGLALARRHLPDLVLCDILMPGTDGPTVLETLRRDPELGDRPFVLITGHPGRFSPREGMEKGADDFLVKPYNAGELLRCVEARLRRAEIPGRVDEAILHHLRATVTRTLPHEIFTPLAGVLGLLEVLLSSDPPLDAAETREILGEIRDCGWRLHRTLRNFVAILDLETPVQGGAVPSGPPGPCAAQPLVVETARQVAANHRRSADLQVTCPPCTMPLRTDALRTIVEELVDNAFAFSRSGSPVRVLCGPGPRLAVTDEGRGMTAEQLAQVGAFRQFERATHEQQGLGLGLALVQRLVARHGGRLQIASEPGGGTTATVEFNP